MFDENLNSERATKTYAERVAVAHDQINELFGPETAGEANEIIRAAKFVEEGIEKNPSASVRFNPTLPDADIIIGKAKEMIGLGDDKEEIKNHLLEDLTLGLLQKVDAVQMAQGSVLPSQSAAKKIDLPDEILKLAQEKREKHLPSRIDRVLKEIGVAETKIADLLRNKAKCMVEGFSGRGSNAAEFIYNPEQVVTSHLDKTETRLTTQVLIIESQLGKPGCNLFIKKELISYPKDISQASEPYRHLRLATNFGALAGEKPHLRNITLDYDDDNEADLQIGFDAEGQISTIDMPTLNDDGEVIGKNTLHFWKQEKDDVRQILEDNLSKHLEKYGIDFILIKSLRNLSVETAVNELMDTVKPTKNMSTPDVAQRPVFIVPAIAKT